MSTVRAEPRKEHVPPHHSPEEIPIALRPQHRKTDSQESYAPGVLLPPRERNSVSSPPPAEANRVMSFEELAERHKEKLHQLQQPLTQNEREQAEVAAARARWERAKEMEKRAVTRRQAEQAAALANKEAKEKQHKPRRSGDALAPVALDEPNRGHGHSRSLSADVLASVAGRRPGSSKRMSTLKVQEWQHRQEEEEEEEALEHPERQPSSVRRNSGVPFPDSASRPPRASRDSRRHSRMPSDPPSLEP